MSKQVLWMTILMGITITTAVQAQQRDAHELDSIANSVFTTDSRGTRAVTAPLKMSLKSSDVLAKGSLTNREAFYIYNSTGDAGRFVIVSGDQRMPAILGYSDKGNFDINNIPDGLKWFLQKCEAEASLMANNPTWTRATDTQDSSNVFPTVEPLLGNRAWGQDAPFNQQCPTINGLHAKTGCVATALAQIMAYYRYPATYDWDKMPDAYNGDYTPEQADAVAQLMHDIGEASEMHYGASVSMTGDFNAESALLNSQFDYDDNVRLIKKDFYTEEKWMQMLINELREGRPIFYDGMNEHQMNAHAFILDGINSEGYFHVNWGWNGDYNGYFLLHSLAYDYTNELGVPQRKDYSYFSDALIYIHPNDSITENEPTNIISDSIKVQSGMGMFPRNTTIELSIFNFMNIRNIPFKGERQLLLVDNETDTLIAPLGKANSMKNELLTGGYYTTALKIKGTLPTDLPDGSYRIYAGVRQNGYEKWGRIKALIQNEDQIRDHLLLILKDGYYTLGTGQIPDGIKTHTAERKWITIYQSQKNLQLTPNIPLAEWNLINVNGSIVTQGKNAIQNETICINTSLPTGIYLLRGMEEDGRIYVTKFVKR